MKTNYKIILAGAILFAVGISILAFEIFGNSSFKVSVEVELVFAFGLVVPGLIVLGVGLMLEFAKQKYEVEK